IKTAVGHRRSAVSVDRGSPARRGGDGAGAGDPAARPPRRPARPTRRGASRRSRARSRTPRPDPRGDGADPGGGAPHLLPGDEALVLAAASGAREIGMGMAHRGRLNVLAHIVNMPYQLILEEFEGGAGDPGADPEGGTGDVKYHLGATGRYRTAAGKDVRVRLLSNPSHLEAVNPVVEGCARADQTDRSGPEARLDAATVVPVLIHGDAAFAGQGVVAETFNLARLRGYTTGGTIHLITNNQIGFTTDPRDGRSTD